MQYHDIDATCLSPINVELVELLGNGNFSEVYRVKYNNNLNYALKIIPLPIDFGNDFEDEAKISQEMSDLGVGVPFIKAWTCPGKSNLTGENIILEFILMELWNKVPQQHSAYQLPANIYSLLLNKISMMHDAGYIHGDPGMRNLVVKTDTMGKIIDIRLIDFGLSFKFTDQEVLKKIDFTERLAHLNSTANTQIIADNLQDIITALSLFDIVGWNQ